MLWWGFSATQNLHDPNTNCSLGRQPICTISGYIFFKNGEEVLCSKSIPWTRKLSSIPTFVHELLRKHLITGCSANHAKPPNAHKHKKYGRVHFERNTHPWLCWRVQAFTFPGICTIYQRHFIHNQTTSGWHKAQHKGPVKLHAVVSRKMVYESIFQRINPS